MKNQNVPNISPIEVGDLLNEEERFQECPPGLWENDANVKEWYAVIVEKSGIVAYTKDNHIAALLQAALVLHAEDKLKLTGYNK